MGRRGAGCGAMVGALLGLTSACTDALQRTLVPRSRFQAQLRPSVRLPKTDFVGGHELV